MPIGDGHQLLLFLLGGGVGGGYEAIVDVRLGLATLLPPLSEELVVFFLDAGSPVGKVIGVPIGELRHFVPRFTIKALDVYALDICAEGGGEHSRLNIHGGVHDVLRAGRNGRNCGAGATSFDIRHIVIGAHVTVPLANDKLRCASVPGTT